MANSSKQVQIRGVLVSVFNKFCANGAIRAELRVDEKGKLWKCVAFGDVAQWYLEKFEGKQGSELSIVGDLEDSEFGDRIKLTHVPYSELKQAKQKHKQQPVPGTKNLQDELAKELAQGLCRIYFKTTTGLTAFEYSHKDRVTESGYLVLSGYKYPRFVRAIPRAIPRASIKEVVASVSGKEGQGWELNEESF